MKARILLLACCLLAFASEAQQSKVQIWMWKDANGVVHYSDVPGPGAVRVDIAVSQGQPGAAPSSGDTTAGTTGPAAPPATATYNSLRIVQPANETSYFEADSVVDVQVESDPPLADGDALYLFLDGQRVGNSGDALAYALSSVDRGAHSLTAAIFDSKGKEKIRSQSVVFYMKQPTVNAPAAVGPNLKPPPRPTPRPATPPG